VTTSYRGQSRVFAIPISLHQKRRAAGGLLQLQIPEGEVKPSTVVSVWDRHSTTGAQEQGDRGRCRSASPGGSRRVAANSVEKVCGEQKLRRRWKRVRRGAERNGNRPPSRHPVSRAITRISAKSAPPLGCQQTAVAALAHCVHVLGLGRERTRCTPIRTTLPDPSRLANVPLRVWNHPPRVSF